MPPPGVDRESTLQPERGGWKAELSARSVSTPLESRPSPAPASCGFLPVQHTVKPQDHERHRWKGVLAAVAAPEIVPGAQLPGSPRSPVVGAGTDASCDG